MFRLLFLTFFGENRASHDVQHHIHESPASMTVPLAILAVLSVIGGYFALLHYLSPVFGAHHEAPVSPLIKYLPTVVGLGGIGLAYVMYVLNPTIAENLASSLSALHNLLLNKYYIDELYDAVIVRPVAAISDWLWQVWDMIVIDGTVNGAGHTVEANGLLLRLWQTGNVQNYALSFLIGAAAILGYYLW
jgi:NADH-quinone oxidoreductase subunit L